MTMKELPWPSVGESIEIDITEPTEMWDDVESTMDRITVYPPMKARLKVYPNYGIVTVGGKIVGRY